MALQKDNQTPLPMNTKADIIVDANAFVNPIFPKQGKLIVGDKGIEFRSTKDKGFIQVPWVNLKMVRADVYDTYVRSIDIITDQDMKLNFVVSEGAELLRCINTYVGRDKICSAGRNLERMVDGAEKGKKKGFFSKFKAKNTES